MVASGSHSTRECDYIMRYSVVTMDVGIRELKAHLSEYLAKVDEGQTIRITDRGHPRALLVPVAQESAIQRGIREGWIAVGSAFGSTSPRPDPRTFAGRPGVRLQDVIDEDRGS